MGPKPLICPFRRRSRLAHGSARNPVGSRRSAGSDPSVEAFDPLTRLGVPTVDELRCVGSALSIHWWTRCGTAIEAEGLGFVPDEFFVVVVCLELRHVLSPEGPRRLHGRPWQSGRIRPGDVFASSGTGPRQGECLPEIVSEGCLLSEVERWRELPDGAIESTMRWLRTAD
jgi:hypothetical protein